MAWFEDAVDDLAEQLDCGELTTSEYNREMRDLREEAREGAEDAASGAYDDYMHHC